MTVVRRLAAAGLLRTAPSLERELSAPLPSPESAAGSLPRATLMGIDVHLVTESEAVEHILSAAARGEGGRVSSLNVDILRLAVADESVGELIREAELVLADGMPIVWATRLLGAPLVERVAPSEMIWSLAGQAARHGVGLFLLGGSEGTAERAVDVLVERYPGLAAGHLCPPFGFERDDEQMRRIFAALDEEVPGVVFCGFGAPKQERLMAELTGRYPGTWFIACGGTFSMVIGDLPKAPLWMRKASLEWLYRLRLEPRRLFGRYVVHDIPFALRLFLDSAQARRHRPWRPGSRG